MNISLTNALETTTAYFVLGIFELNVPFYGGILVPDFNPPGGFLILVTNGDGEIHINDTWPPGLPAGLTVYFQYWMIDPGGPFGFASSNAIAGIVP